MLYFPNHLLVETSLSWQLVKRSTLPPGQTGAGFIPFAETSGGGLWRAELNSIPIRNKNQVLTWRALEAVLDGGASQIVVPLCDKRYFPAPPIGVSYPQIPHDDDAMHDDGAGYYQAVVTASLAQGAPLRATEIVVTMVSGAAPQAGQMFSITHPNMRERAYVIASATDDGVLTIRPPLREAVEAGEAINFDCPSCVMQIATPENLKLTLSLRKFGSPSAVFLESFDPAMLNGTRRVTLPGA